MNYGQIKQNLISLGFAEESDYEEFEELGYTYDAINRAIDIIETQFPQIAKYEFEVDESDTGILYIDMTDRPGFKELSKETPVVFEANGEDVYRKFADYYVEMDHTIVMKANDYAGSFRIYYNKGCSTIDSDTPDSFIPELPNKVHHLIPLLASYYLWLDDDERKAVQYKNDYDEALIAILQQESLPRMRVRTDYYEKNTNSAFPKMSHDEWRKLY